MLIAKCTNCTAEELESGVGVGEWMFELGRIGQRHLAEMWRIIAESNAAASPGACWVIFSLQEACAKYSVAVNFKCQMEIYREAT